MLIGYPVRFSGTKAAQAALRDVHGQHGERLATKRRSLACNV